MNASDSIITPRTNHETHQRHEKKTKSKDDPFPLHFGMMAEIDEQTETMAGRMQIVVNLGMMIWGQFRNAFDLQNDLLEENENRENRSGSMAALWSGGSILLGAGMESLVQPIPVRDILDKPLRGTRTPFPCTLQSTLP
jgi:hypothetical protein